VKCVTETLQLHPYHTTVNHIYIYLERKERKESRRDGYLVELKASEKRFLAGI
jgi:hypothetical protein